MFHSLFLLAAALTGTAAPVSHMINARGWTVLILSVSTVLSLVSYCLYRVLTLPPVEMQDLHGPLDIDTRDKQDAD